MERKSTQDFYFPVQVSPVRALDPNSAPARRLAAFLAGRKAETIKAFRADLEDFQVFVGALTLIEAAQLLLARGQGEANAQALAYRTHTTPEVFNVALVNGQMSETNVRRPSPSLLCKLFETKALNTRL